MSNNVKTDDDNTESWTTIAIVVVPILFLHVHRQRPSKVNKMQKKRHVTHNPRQIMVTKRPTHKWNIGWDGNWHSIEKMSVMEDTQECHDPWQDSSRQLWNDFTEFNSTIAQRNKLYTQRMPTLTDSQYPIVCRSHHSCNWCLWRLTPMLHPYTLGTEDSVELRWSNSPRSAMTQTSLCHVGTQQN